MNYVWYVITFIYYAFKVIGITYMTNQISRYFKYLYYYFSMVQVSIADCSVFAKSSLF